MRPVSSGRFSSSAFFSVMPSRTSDSISLIVATRGCRGEENKEKKAWSNKQGGRKGGDSSKGDKER